MPPRHVVLVGLPGSGKSTAGRIAATLLDAPFIDLDRLIETRAGQTVDRIITEQGEPAFRKLESEIGSTVLAGPPGILAPGGGYFVAEAVRRSTLDKAYVVYLHVSPSIAARRLQGTNDRPLLKGFDVTLRLAQFLQRREEAYLQAHAKVSTDVLTAEQVAGRLAVLARSDGGW